MRGGDEAVALAVDGDPAVHLVELLHDGLGALPVDLHAVAAGAGGVGGDVVDDSAQLEVDGEAGLVLGLGAPAAGGAEQPVRLDAGGLLVGLDGRGDQRDPRVLVGDQPAVGADAVDPAGVGPGDLGGPATLRRDPGDLGLRQQFEDEALVRGAALDDDGGLGHRATQPAQRLGAGASERDDLGDHGVEVCGDGVALGDAGVDADARPRGQVEAGDEAGRGREVAVRVLRVEAGLDGVAELGGPVVELLAGRDPDLGLDQVEVVGDLGDGVLHLQAGVDLEECELPLAGVVEELDGARALVPHRERQPLGGLLDVGVLLGAQQR